MRSPTLMVESAADINVLNPSPLKPSLKSEVRIRKPYIPKRRSLATPGIWGLGA